MTLDVSVGNICDDSTNDEDGVEHDTRAGVPATLARTSRDLVSATGLGGRVTRDALQFSDQQTVEDLAGFVRVANIFEGFGGVLTAYIEEDFFATTVTRELVWYHLVWARGLQALRNSMWGS